MAADTEGLRAELSKALVIIDNTRKEYKQSLCPIEAMRESHNIGVIVKPAMQDESAGLARYPRRFGDWLKWAWPSACPWLLCSSS